LTAGGKLQLATITHTARLMRHAEREEASQGAPTRPDERVSA
jgi:hypothetical protein